MDTAIDVARHSERIDNLERWQRTQNGELRRMAERLEKLDEKLDQQTQSVRTWLIALLTSALLSVALLALNLATKALGG